MKQLLPWLLIAALLLGCTTQPPKEPTTSQAPTAEHEQVSIEAATTTAPDYFADPFDVSQTTAQPSDSPNDALPTTETILTFANGDLLQAAAPDSDVWTIDADESDDETAVLFRNDDGTGSSWYNPTITIRAVSGYSETGTTAETLLAAWLAGAAETTRVSIQDRVFTCGMVDSPVANEPQMLRCCAMDKMWQHDDHYDYVLLVVDIERCNTETISLAREFVLQVKMQIQYDAYCCSFSV